ncbi:hypothetical protein M3Y97_00212000 [Aphelenchoides bicaudatus]|nr:hypothetical protein M3Y97_00212000 [Aphelenchoides bicaudatus]
MAGALHGPERDAADFMTELQRENPDTYKTWLAIESRDEFNEKFRRSFIGILCRFCINRKQMELARYRRDFVGAVLSYTKADIGVNLFCDKNGGGFLNNSLKSRRAYQKRRRECGWQESSSPASFLPQGSTLSSLLQSFRQQQHQAIQPTSTSVAEMLRRTSSLEPIQMRSPSPLPVTSDHHSTTLADSPLADTIIKGNLLKHFEFTITKLIFADHCFWSLRMFSDRASSSSSSSTSAASLFSVFVRYRRVNQEWKDMELKQSKLSFSSFATVQHLYNTLTEKWQLRSISEERLILRIFDKEFEEYVDLEEDYSLISLENLAKYELIHRVTNADIENENNKLKSDTKNNNVLFESKNVVKMNDEYNNIAQNVDLTNIIKNLQENAAVINNDNLNSENPLDVFIRNAAFFLRNNQNQLVDEKPSDSQQLTHPFQTLMNANNPPFNAIELIENLVGHSFVGSANVEENVPKFDILEILTNNEQGRDCIKHFQALESGKEKFLASEIKTKLIAVLGQWLVLNCQKIGIPSEEERHTFVEHVLEQLPIKLDPAVFSEALDNFVQNHQQMSCSISSRKRQQTIRVIEQN